MPLPRGPRSAPPTHVLHVGALGGEAVGGGAQHGLPRQAELAVARGGLQAGHAAGGAPCTQQAAAQPLAMRRAGASEQEQEQGGGAGHGCLRVGGWVEEVRGQ